MESREILEKAIQKAIDRGWEYPGFKCVAAHLSGLGIISSFIVKDLDKDTTEQDSYFLHYKAVIFNHDFAKALWPEQGYYWYAKPGRTGETRNELPIEDWKRHLMAMVTADDPIKYLGEHM